MHLPTFEEPVSRAIEATITLGAYAHLFVTRGRDWFLRRSFLTQLGLTFLVLVIGIAGLVCYLKEASKHAKIMSEALATRLMTNDQQYSALEAFLLAPMATPGAGRWSSGASPARQLDDLSESLAGLSLPTAMASLRGRTDLKWDDHGGRFLTTANPTAYLFVPGFTFANSPHGLVGENPAPALSVLQEHSSLAIDVAGAYLALPVLKRILPATIDELHVVQCYYMAESGALLIMGWDATKRTIDYQRKFPANRYFPARPYFAQSLDPSNSIGEFDCRTVPYIDYGGNGPIVTYCKSMRLSNGHAAIIGIDCSVPNADSTLLAQLNRIDHNYVKFELHQSNGRLLLTESDAGRLTHAVGNIGWLRRAIDHANERNEAAEVTGTILAQANARGDRDRIAFVVPTGWRTSPIDTSATCVLASIDTGKLSHLWWVLFGGIIAFFLSGGGAALMIMQYGRVRREQE